MIHGNITRSVRGVILFLIGFLSVALVGTAGYADAFQRHDGGPGRTSRGYDGRRDHSRAPRGGEFRSRRAHPRAPRAGEYRGPKNIHRSRRDVVNRNNHRRGRISKGNVVRHERRFSGYRDGRSHYRKGIAVPRYGRHPKYGHNVKRTYRRHICRPGLKCYHYHRRPYYRGRPYWGYSPGYVRVRPPIGSLFLSLPLGCFGFYVGGSIYYYYDDVYYRPVSSGYVVVSPPAVAVPQIASGEVEYTQVSVTAALLNVRSGPGAGHPVFRQVRRGEILTVAEESDGWLYIELGDGEKGWIDARYAAPMVAVNG
ncbi:MAG: SH3 domain-containing protein [Desulfococcus multivorans]|uniref:SH3 domain-containing protein n=1 Tax=Desulfococcus sp. TaxID=2025834 RepID=UPI002A3D3295|nr:SH3 domain-containing protein [Desulfococcus multivorans]